MKLPFLPRIRIKRLILLVLFLALVAGGFAVYWWWTDGLAYGNAIWRRSARAKRAKRTFLLTIVR